MFGINAVMLVFASLEWWELVAYSFITSVVVLVAFLKYIRPRFPVAVNCWFCNSNCHVSYVKKNSWDCPHCEQYNGFCQNGDYNKPIPSQYDEILNPSNKSGISVASQSDKVSNGLCEVCNRNQLLKIKQLAAFVPQHEESFESEVDAYERYLDSVYKLCGSCEIVLCQKVRQQDLSMRGQVLAWKLRQKKMLSSTLPKPQKFFQFFHQVPIYIKLLQLCSLIIICLICIQSIHLLQIETHLEVFPLQSVFAPKVLTLLICGGDCNPFFSLFGFFILITTILAAGKDRLRMVDALDCFVWLITLFVQLPCIASLFASKEDRLIIQGLLAFVGILFTFGCFICNRPAVSCQRSWSSIKSSPSSYSYPSDHSVCSESLGSSYSSLWQDGSVNQHANEIEFGKKHKLLQDHQISTTTRSSEKMSKGWNLDFSLGSHLQAMQISTPRKPQCVSGIFTPKTYNSPKSPWTSSHHRHPLHRSILSPARFQAKRVAHSSWVAGGFWASSNSPHHSLSVYGSQSDLCSDLSHGSSPVEGKFMNGYSRPLNISCSCPTSRTSSVCGDDRLSVFSEPARAASPSLPFTPHKGRSSYLPEPLNTSLRDVSLERCTSSSSNSSSSSTASRRSLIDMPEKTLCANNSQFQQTPQNIWRTSMFIKILVGCSILSNLVLVAFFVSTYAS